MSKVIYVFFEGDGKLVPGFNAFFRSVRTAARSRRMNVRPVAGGTTAVRDFNWARDEFAGDTVLLLVDSEGPVADDPRQAPSLRPHITHLAGADQNQLHLMVQCMETWFLADKPALKEYYRQGFLADRLPPNPRVEDVSKDDVQRGLKGATKGTRKGEYHKTRHAPELLAMIAPSDVRKAAPSCERLFRALENVVASQTDAEAR